MASFVDNDYLKIGVILTHKILKISDKDLFRRDSVYDYRHEGCLAFFWEVDHIGFLTLLFGSSVNTPDRDKSGE